MYAAVLVTQNTPRGFAKNARQQAFQSYAGVASPFGSVGGANVWDKDNISWWLRAGCFPFVSRARLMCHVMM
jgi:hypothetical protein